MMDQGRQRCWRPMLIAGSLLAIGNADAQSLDSEPAIDEIIVTGSRISRTDVDGPLPVVTYSFEELRSAGVNTLSDFNRYLPYNSETFSEAQGVGRADVGASQFNLRGVGFDSTLTLLNGRRIAPYGVGVQGREYFVDINSIPFAAVERIEILKDGASAIYGADAVAGVVNVILKRDYEGLQVQATGLTSADGDISETDVSMLAGQRLGRGSWMAAVSYFDRGDLLSIEREFTADADLRSRGGFNNRSLFSSPPTTLNRNTFQTLPDPSCPAEGPRNSVDVRVPGFVEFCLYNFQLDRVSIANAERLGITATFDYEFSDAWSFYADAVWNDNNTRHTGTPSAVSGSSPLPTITGSPLVLASHPNNPFGTDIEVALRLLDAGGLETAVDSNTGRLVVGVEFDNGSWLTDVAVNLSESDVRSQRDNLIAFTPLQEALLGAGGPDDDQFYNPFGIDPVNDPLVVDEITGLGISVATSTEAVIDVTVTGDAMEMKNGPLGVSAGYQFRRQELDESLNAFLASGDIAGGVPPVPIDGERDIHAIFGELSVPVTATLEAQLAVRWEDYSDFGSTTNPKVALGWRPVDSLLLRASYATSFRAPAFRELDLPESEFIGAFQDAKRCPLTGDPNDCNTFPYRTTTTGNPALEPEEGESINVGLLWRPDAGAPLSIQLDWWEIDHDDRIVDIDGQTIIDEFPLGNPFVERMNPTPEEAAMGIPGRISSVNTSFFNADRVTVRGLDLEMRHTWRLGSVGELDLSVSYTYLDEWKFEQGFATGSVSEDFAGRKGFVGPLPEHRGLARLTWRFGEHQFGATASFVGEYRSSINRVENGQQTATPFDVNSWTTVDVQYATRFGSLNDAELRIGCQNCFDRNPPVYNYTSLWEGLHDGRGATVYLSWTQPLFADGES